MWLEWCLIIKCITIDSSVNITTNLYYLKPADDIRWTFLNWCFTSKRLHPSFWGDEDSWYLFPFKRCLTGYQSKPLITTRFKPSLTTKIFQHLSLVLKEQQTHSYRFISVHIHPHILSNICTYNSKLIHNVALFRFQAYWLRLLLLYFHF